MFPLWNRIIAPVLEAAGARRVLEIGSLRGETTVKLLDLLGPDAEVHVIDPVPMFDPTEHELKFKGRYIFHRDTSHNVLASLPVVDAALIDGDHNWYTVYHELRMLASTAREAGAHLPVLVMHDVGWPYGRRDLYYAPETIPEEFRQPYAQQGMHRRRKELLPQGGINPTMNNALLEGGPRNGVMTALDDFIAEHDQPVRRIVLPIYFGLAVVVEEARLVEQPRLAKVLDRLETAEHLRRLLELAESLRLKEVEFAQRVFFGNQDRIQRAARRYLDMLRAALDEMRGGPTDSHGVEALEPCLETIRTETVEGDLVACDARRGDRVLFMRGFLDAYELPAAVWAAGTTRSPADERPSLFGVLDRRVGRLEGPPAEALGDAPIEKIALLLVDTGDAASTVSILDLLYDRITLGGFVLVDEGGDPACRRAVDELRTRRGIEEPLERVGGTARWRKTSHAGSSERRNSSTQV